MGMRDKMNGSPAVTAIILLLLMGGGVFFIYRYTHPAHIVYKEFSRTFYSDDDGQTFYVDDVSNIPPYDHGGKEAVRALVVRCGDGKPFVWRLEKYNDVRKQIIQRGVEAGNAPPMPGEPLPGLMVKLPGEKTWTDFGFQAAAQPELLRYAIPKCPEGSTGTIKYLLPEDLEQH